MRSGLYVTAINHHLTPDDVAYIVGACGAKALIVSAEKAETALAADIPGVSLRLALGGEIAGHAYEAALPRRPRAAA
jgi:fatty-acyl-CoA synthase